MKVVTAEQIRGLDRRAIEEIGMPGAALMENAGSAVVDVIAAEYGPLQNRRIAVFCGAGNNGGDGFVIARYLHLLGADAIVYMAGDPAKLKDDARIHYEILRKSESGTLCFLFSSEGVPDGAEGKSASGATISPGVEKAIAEADCIVDALFGTGLSQAPRSPYNELIASINRSGKPIVAVDVPSGINSDTGETPGVAIRATHTVTFAYPKLGLFLYPAADLVGKLHVANIGFEWDRLASDVNCRLIALPYRNLDSAQRNRSSDTASKVPHPIYPETAAKLLESRQADSNKGEFGHVGVLAGSQGMVGAPALTARAAQKSGAGLVTVLAAACAQPAIAAKLDEQMTIPLPDREGAVSVTAFDIVAEFAQKATVLCIGPGLTTKAGAVALVRRILSEVAIPIVLDADGLNILAQNPDCIDGRSDNPDALLVLTPHPGEAARLLGTTIAEVESNRVTSVRELARRYRAVVLLKGRYTLVCDPEGEIVINTSGNPGMATGGAGDALTGVTGALLAHSFAARRKQSKGEQHKDNCVRPVDAVALAAYLHGLAGDLAAERIGEIGMVAGDIVTYLPDAMRRLEITD